MSLSIIRVAVLGFATAAAAGDWPQWRGPFFNGSADATGLPAQWDPVRGAAWSVPVPGKGAATPSIAGDLMFVTYAAEDGGLHLGSFDARTGASRWTRRLGGGDFSRGHNNLASPSPVTDGRHVWALFGSGDMAALDAAGSVLWSRNLASEFGAFANMWIYGSSPLLLDGRLYIQVLQRNPPTYPHAVDGRPDRESFILCVDAATGRDLWRHVRVTDAEEESMESYATPYPMRGREGWTLIVSGADHVTAHRADDGSEIWRSRGLNNEGRKVMRVVASPVAVDGVVVACVPKREPVLGIRAGGQGDVTESHRAWTFDGCIPDVCSPLVYRGRLYILDGDKRTMACLDPVSGQSLWLEKLPVTSVIRASPTGADGKIYVISENGEVVVLRAGDIFEQLAVVPMGDGPCRASVAVANNRLFIRTAGALHCIGGK